MKFLIPLVLVCTGCSNINGLFDVEPSDCSITAVEADLESVFVQSDAKGLVYVRRGTCTVQDRLAYERAVK